MNENNRKLQLLFKLTRLKPEMFYSISFTNYEIDLQGKEELLHYLCDELKFIQTNWSKKHYVRGNIYIIKA